MATHGGEGVIKYDLQFTTGPNDFDRYDILDLIKCRDALYALGLVGTSGKYCGRDDRGCETVGYGNVSLLLPNGRIAISGTQTGGIVHLEVEDFTTILECYPEINRVVAQGPKRKPSSEIMTHKTVYNISPNTKAVVHVHSDRLWKATHENRLTVPMTSINVEYGTPEMAYEVRRLFGEADLDRIKFFGMKGHEDGFVSFGSNVDEAQAKMVEYFNKAL